MFRGLRIIVPAALLVASVGLATTACAAQIWDNRSYRQVDRRAYDNGYRQGVRDGENDVRRNRNYSPQQHGEYRDADQGYRRNDGNIDQYRRSYRQGYQTGYNESFNRYGNYGGSSRYPTNPNYPTYPTNPNYPTYPTYPNGTAIPRGSYSPASDNGYRDGLEQGRNAARHGDRFDPVREKRYRDGDHNYNSRYGSRDQYKREYRVAFEQGYRDGYQRGF